MRISVVVPVYNVETYIHECLDSLLAQTVPAYEIILVDDGSKDNSGIICDSYADRYSQIKVIHKQNEGLGMARNSGMDIAAGDYIMFVDSDDFCQNDMLERLAQIIEETECDTCKISFNRVNLQGEFLFANTIESGDFAGDQVQTILLPRLIGSAPDKHDAIPMSACATMYSMDLIRQNNLRFVSERQWISEDIIFNIAYFAKATHVVLSGYAGYNYRVNPESLTTSYRKDRFEKCLALYHEQKRLLSEMGLYELSKYRLSRQFFLYLRMCFDQFNSDLCTMSGKQIRHEIKAICTHSHVQRVIEDYPTEKMGIKQRMFVYMVQNKMSWLLYLFYGTNLFPRIG